MCVISGGISKQNVVSRIITGLMQVEYQGCDSVGIASLEKGEKLKRIRMTGRVKQLSEEIQKQKFAGNLAIAHTRKATHGLPSEANAHPHFSCSSVGVVHNGEIENCIVLRQYLERKGYTFKSETDTEVIVHLIHHYSKMTTISEAVALTVFKLKGQYSIAVISNETPDELIISHQGLSLVLGSGKDENFFASDISALPTNTNNFTYLQDGDVASVKTSGIVIFSKERKQIQR